MKENIHFNQHPVSSYVSQSVYLWCRIFLLPWRQYSPNINGWIGNEESFQKMCTFTPPPPSPTFRFSDKASEMKTCCETTDSVILAFTPPLPLSEAVIFGGENFHYPDNYRHPIVIFG